MSNETRADVRDTNRELAEKISVDRRNERIDRVIEKSPKAERSVSHTLLASINPLAPAEPRKESRWLSREAWITVAASAAPNATPVEVRHEARCGMVIWSW